MILFFITEVCIVLNVKKNTDTSNEQFTISKNGRNMKRNMHNMWNN